MENAIINLENTPLSEQYREQMKNKYNFMITNDVSVSKIVSCTLWAMGKYLSSLEDKKEKANGVYIYMNTSPAEKLFASILEYDANAENEENPGAFEFTTSYDPEITQKANIPYSDALFIEILGSTLINKAGYGIPSIEHRCNICAEAFSILKDFVSDQVQANPTEVFEFEHPGIFVIRGGVEDGVIIVSMVPGADLKSKCIKDDLNSEK